MRYVFKQDSAWIGKRPVGGGNKHRLFCLCGDVSPFDPIKLSRYLLTAEVYRVGYGSAEEVPLYRDVAIPTFQPLPLVRRPQPFSHSDWLFEVKHDGFRALVYAEHGVVRLVSRNGNTFATFKGLTDGIGRELKGTVVVLDGEIACLDEHGCSQFNQLFFRRGTPRFCAFDILWLNGRDLRDLPLVERKRALRSVVPRHSDHLLYVDCIDTNGENLFELACERDLEGIVAKHRQSRYAVEDGNPAWVKVRNPRYTQMVGRDELFERRYEAQGAPQIGWDTCDRACVAANRA